MIKVCDSMMGSGKSSAAINHMNDHPDRRFIYITPYIEETQRIAAACPALNFVEPSNTSPRFKFSKLYIPRSSWPTGATLPRRTPRSNCIRMRCWRVFVLAAIRLSVMRRSM